MHIESCNECGLEGTIIWFLPNDTEYSICGTCGKPNSKIDDDDIERYIDVFSPTEE